MHRQLGQSMAEYLVALGIGGSIVAALTLVPCPETGGTRGCVPAMLDALHNNYEGYSAAIGDVQDYGDVEVAAPPSDEVDDGVDDEDMPDGGDDTVDDSDVASLGKVNQIYDANGNLLGTVQGETIYGLDGSVIGSYEYDAETGQQTAVIDGQEITGVSVVGVFIGKDGDPLELKAFVVNGQVVGFGYVDDGKFYEPLKGEETDKVPDGADVHDLRAVKIRDGNGKVSDFGYEVGGYIFSLAKVKVANESYSSAKVPDAELVEMRLTQSDTLSDWSGYSTCIARSLDWVNNELSGYPGSGDFTFDKTEEDADGNDVTTTNNAVVESPTNNVGFIDSADIGSGGCQGRWVLQENTDSWTLSGPN